MAWIRTVDYEHSEGLLRAEYDKAIRRAGRVFNIIKLQGLRPTHLKCSTDLYATLMHGPGALTRGRREMLAIVVSKANHCHY